MEEVLNVAYKNDYPVITFLTFWLIDTFTIDLRNGNIFTFSKKDKVKFIKFCKTNLKGKTVNYIEAGYNITLKQSIIQ